MAESDRGGGVRPQVKAAEENGAEAGLSFGPVLMLLGVVAVAAAQGVPDSGLGSNADPGPRMFPTALGIGLALGGVYELVVWFRRRRAIPASGRAPGKAAGGIRGLLTDPRNREMYFLLAALALYIPAIPVAGFALSTVLFACGVMRLLGTGWVAAALTSFGLVAVIHLLFVLLFKVQLPTGVWG